ncbi:MAG: 2-polyprenylphenol 6-hydroxylase [Pseudomonadota bacterium]|nr:2-polyprenylphenol 6-hydroxylase [Pseudomonadota bacterium]
MVSGLRHFRRIVSVTRTLARHDALFLFERDGFPRKGPFFIRLLMLAPRISGMSSRREGERLAAALTELGPSFIKLGQALSVRPDLVGEALANDLRMLQDQLPPFDGEVARQSVEAELGKPVQELFATFETEPIAAASIAQVHRATLTNGRQVAVKILRPDIELAFARDLDLARWAAVKIENARPALRRLKPVEAVDTIIRSVEIEMDLRFEAAAADELRENLADESRFSVPEVDWAYTSRRVMTTGWIDATPVNELDLTQMPAETAKEIVANFAKIFFLQVFRDGFFHADLHPGNIFIDNDGVFHAVDFGIMGRLDKRTRQYLAEMLHGFLTGDYRQVAAVHIKAGYVPADQSVDEFAQAARSIAEPILGLPLGEISLARLLAQLFAVTEKFNMEAQPQLLLLQKTMLVAEGVGRRLCPDVNMWELARPLIEDWMLQHMGPEARIRDAADSMLDIVERLPHLVTDMEESIGHTARHGIRVDPASLDALAGRRGGSWRSWGVVAVIVVIIALILD